jgi:LysR family transcriptional activator of dmlA
LDIIAAARPSVSGACATAAVARKIGVNQLVVCASPKYLKKAPPLKEASDLKSHPLLFLESHRNMRYLKSDLRISDLAKNSKIGCQDGGVLTALAVEGVGVAI